MYQLTGEQSTPPRGTETDWTTWLTVIRRRRKLALSVAGVVFALTLILTALTPRTYTTTVKFIAGGRGGGATNSPAGGSSLPLLNALLASSGAESAETYAELFQETPTARKAIQKLKLNIDPGELLSRVKVKPITDTAIVGVSVSWRNPEESARIANALAHAFIEYRRDMVSHQAQTALDYLTTQLPQAESTVHQTATQLSEYEALHKIVDITAQTQQSLTTINQLEAKRAEAQVNERQAEAQLGSVQSQLGSVSPDISGGQQYAPNPVLAQLQTQLAQVTMQLRTAQEHYTDLHPTVVALKSQKSELEREIGRQTPTVVSAQNTVPNPLYQQLQQQAATLQAQVASYRTQDQTLTSQLTALEPTLKRLPSQAAQLMALQRRAKLAQDVYDELQRKNGEAMVARSSALSDVTIVQGANAQDAIVKPSTFLNLVLGGFIGLSLGIGAALSAEVLDKRIHGVEDVEQRLSLPVLATIPMAGPKEIAALPWLQSLSIESYFQFVTALRYASSTRLKTIAITSARPGEGKSTVAVSTAIALAETEPRILLIDGDLRRPLLHAKLGIRPTHGLSDYLVGRARYEDVIQNTKHPGLDLLSAGTRTANSYRLLQSDEFKTLLDRAGKSYTTIIIDTPAIEPIIDAAVVAARVDGTVIVIAAGETDSEISKRAVGKLHGAGVRNILGAVLNKSNPRKDNTFNPYYLDPGDERPALT
jgi:capsular exopolysaccharide synthesis family protein